MAQVTISILLILGVSCIIRTGEAQLQLGGFGLGGIGDILTCAQQFQAGAQVPNPDIGKKTPEYLDKYGYPVETHTVNTSDGYVLTVYRVPYSPKSPLVDGVKKKAVYLNHGLGGNGQQWMIQYPGQNLGMLMADKGFDVFFSNGRGTSYSGPNSTQENDPNYWDFSWHEMAMYDVPAVIDMILSVTGTEKLYYIGHSMGTTQYFITMSELPEYNSKIYTGILLAPIAYIPHATNVVRLLAPLGYNDQYLVEPVLGGKIDFGQSFENMTGLSLGTLCSPSALACTACSNGMFLIFGYDGPQMNYTNLGYMLSLFPDNVSTKSLVHYAQSMVSGKFRQFDYGTPWANEAKYGAGVTCPPEYDLSVISAPTVFMNGLNDNLGVPQDVNTTASKMNPSVLKEFYTIPLDTFNHMDFIIAKDGKTVLYDRILNIMVDGTYE